MALRGDERQQLAERLRALVKSAQLIETARDRYTWPQHAAARQNLIAGRLTMHRDGYGFVIPNAGQRSTIEGDIFIPPPAIGSAMHGDQVLVELAPQATSNDGRAEGPHPARADPRQSHRCRHLPSRLAAQLRHPDRRKGHAGVIIPARYGVAGRRRPPAREPGSTVQPVFG